MSQNDLPPGLSAFLAVADAGGFTAAAVRLGISASAVSQQIRALETRLGTTLLHRTTRSVRLTDAGERYRSAVEPAHAAILDASRGWGEDEEPQGVLRLTLPRTAFQHVLRPVLAAYRRRHPQVRVELSIENALVDVVRDGFDAGIRFGDRVEQDMVSVRIGPDLRIALLAAPAYVRARGLPIDPDELPAHDCIGFRSATNGTIETWHLSKNGQDVRFVPPGPIVVNSTEALLAAIEDGIGIGEFVSEFAAEALRSGRLVAVLNDWCPPLPGFHLYYPHRRRASGALKALRTMLTEAQR